MDSCESRSHKRSLLRQGLGGHDFKRLQKNYKCVHYRGRAALTGPRKACGISLGFQPLWSSLVMGAFFRSPLGIRDLSYVEPVTLFAENYRKADSALREKSACSTEKL
jgi:hypothetical protein